MSDSRVVSDFANLHQGQTGITTYINTKYELFFLFPKDHFRIVIAAAFVKCLFGAVMCHPVL